MNIIRKAATLGVGLAAATGLAVLPAGTAHAATACWDAGWSYSGTVGGTVTGTWAVHYCNNVPNTPVYEQPFSNSAVTGTVTSNPSWFVCKTDEGGYNGEPTNLHPYRWIWTQSDTGGWGWMSDAAIYSETNPIPDCLTP